MNRYGFVVDVDPPTDYSGVSTISTVLIDVLGSGSGSEVNFE